jgi:hypothetical protein
MKVQRLFDYSKTEFDYRLQPKNKKSFTLYDYDYCNHNQFK